MIPSRETKENRQHSTPLIPYSYYSVNIPESLNNVPMHWHSEFELNRILRGAGEFICGDERFTAKEGEVLLIPPNMLHAAYPLENHELVYQVLVFHPAMIGANTNDRCTIECIRPIINGSVQVSNAIGPESQKYDEIKSSVDCIFSCVYGNLPQLDLLLKSELLRLFWLLDQTELSTIDDTSISYTEIIRPALEYMTKNLQETITIDRLADLSHLSKSYFMSCFKKAVGMGAIEHLTHLRINAACDALSDTNKIISEIAFSCGYSNLSNFNRQFKQIMGCSPKEYRKRKAS
ncbi:MAG: AraC family transcriptional regulator [Lachnospiraceae bacterium]|nr:AraC family transcriptional regulator [Lachnospiraceae bacterium]MBP3578011.1 AraC family transcriptional regulator [Lachnospiraceae bacterium]